MTELPQPSPNRKKRISWRMLTLLGLLAAIGGEAFIGLRNARQARLQMDFERVHVTPSMREEAVAALGPFEDVELVTSDGLRLRGWYVPAKRRAAVIFVTGGAANRMQPLPEARELVAHGFGVLLFDSRASGESEGSLTTWGETEQRDLVSALDFVSARSDVDPARIGVQGLSIGGSTVALTAAKDERARAVLLNATWTSLSEEIAYKFGKFGPFSAWPAQWVFRDAGIRFDAIRPIDHIAEISPRPLLIITGAVDEDTPVPVMERLFAAARAPKDMWVVSGAGHGGYAEAAPVEYPRRVRAFFEATLGPRE